MRQVHKRSEGNEYQAQQPGTDEDNFKVKMKSEKVPVKWQAR